MGNRLSKLVLVGLVLVVIYSRCGFYVNKIGAPVTTCIHRLQIHVGLYPEKLNYIGLMNFILMI